MSIRLIVGEIEPEINIAKLVGRCPSSDELVRCSLLDGDHPGADLGTLLLAVVVVTRDWTVEVAGALVGNEISRTQFLFPYFQIWLHADIRLFAVTIFIQKIPATTNYNLASCTLCCKLQYGTLGLVDTPNEKPLRHFLYEAILTKFSPDDYCA